jgi:hypothetical protein
MGVSASELARIQADAAAQTLTLTCQIQRKTLTSDGAGGSTTTWNTIATVQAGMSLPTAGQLQNYDYLIGSLAAWQVKLPVGTNVQVQDRLVISGQTLIVQIVLTPRSLPALLTVLASEIK